MPLPQMHIALAYAVANAPPGALMAAGGAGGAVVGGGVGAGIATTGAGVAMLTEQSLAALGSLQPALASIAGSAVETASVISSASSASGAALGQVAWNGALGGGAVGGMGGATLGWALEYVAATACTAGPYALAAVGSAAVLWASHGVIGQAFIGNVSSKQIKVYTYDKGDMVQGWSFMRGVLDPGHMAVFKATDGILRQSSTGFYVHIYDMNGGQLSSGDGFLVRPDQYYQWDGRRLRQSTLAESARRLPRA